MRQSSRAKVYFNFHVGDMTAQEITAFLEKVYPGQKVKFLGHGSDSMAFRVDGRVFRFSDKDISIYAKEAGSVNFCAII